MPDDGRVRQEKFFASDAWPCPMPALDMIYFCGLFLVRLTANI